jgi:hypothetical protein
MNALLKGGKLTREDMSKMILSFGINVVNVFQGGKKRMTKQIKDSWAPFSIGVHYVVHRTNLAIQLLVDLNFIV